MKKTKLVVLFLVLLALSVFAIYIRLDLISFVSGDYETYTSQWMNHLKQNGPFYSFAQRFSNYSPAYLHLLSINLWLNLKDLYFIKYLSFLFEIFSAIAVYKIIMVRWKNETIAAVASILFLSLPTVVMNGAQWGQCDMIYTGFILWSFYFLLTSRPAFCSLLLGIAFAFKLQTVFVFPFFLLLFLQREIKWKSLLFIILPFLFSLIPSYLAGRDWGELLSVYFAQDADFDENLSLNFPGLYTLFHLPAGNFAFIRNTGVILTGILTLSLIYLFFRKKAKPGPELFLKMILFFSLLVPFFLPRMHERYYFMAEVFSLVYAFYYRKQWWLPVILQVSAINTYYNYLYGEYLFPITLSTILVLLGIVGIFLAILRTTDNYSKMNAGVNE